MGDRSTFNATKSALAANVRAGRGRRREHEPFEETISLPPPPADYGVVLLSHGSADPRARLACDLLARRVGHRLGAFVAQATLDLDRPRLDGAINYLASKHIHDLVVVPMLLTTAYHATQDVPAFALATQKAYPQARVTMASPIGADPHLLRGMDTVLKAAGHRPNPETAVVLASAGSSFAPARARHAALAMQWRSHGWGPRRWPSPPAPVPPSQKRCRSCAKRGLTRCAWRPS